MGIKKVAFISHNDANIYLFRLSWIKRLEKEGFKVYVFTPSGKYCDKLKKEGIKVINYKFSRGNLNPLNLLYATFELYNILKKEHFDIVQTFTLQPNIYGTIAAKLAGVPIIVNMFEGLGYLFINNKNIKKLILRKITNFILKFTLEKATKVIFLNQDDFNDLKHLFDNRKAIIINGTGVDIEHYSSNNVNLKYVENLKENLNIKNNDIVITLIARLCWSKGIKEFVEAAKILIRKYKNLKFLIVGPIDNGNPDRVDMKFIKSNQNEYIKFLGSRDDIRELLFLTDIYVLPSYYREGVPRTILEAMSMGKPVITTNVPGCKETVKNGYNGILVPPRKVGELVRAIEILIKDKNIREKFGKNSRKLVEEKFSDSIITELIVNLYKELLAKIS